MTWLLVLALPACRADPRCPDGGSAIACDGSTAIVCDEGRRVDELTCDATDICAVDQGCVPCRLELPTALSAPIDLQPVGEGEAWRTFGWRAIPLEGGGRARIRVDGPFEVYDDTATPVTELQLPATAFVHATTGGTGSLEFWLDGCDSGTPVELTAHPDPGLSATLRAAGAAGSFVDAFPNGGTVRIGLDPVRHADRVGQTGILYVVEDRNREEWSADPSLVEAIALPRPITMADGGLDANLFEVWAAAQAEPGVPGRYDLVVDYDDNGRLDPGDLIDGLDGAGFTLMPNLSEPGPYIPRIDEVSGGFFLTQRVYWPIEIDTFDTPAPLVVISHGNGHEYDWYDYLGEHLASWGYVVMSHRNDTNPGVLAAATTTLTNTDAFVINHTLISPTLEGKVDVNRIVWIGHSRGGEGVLLAHERLRAGNASVQALQPSDVVLISSIAPTVFEDPRQANPGGVPYHIITGAADGDVTGGVGSTVPFPGPCPLCQWWRLTQAGTAQNHVTYLHGAIHNDFNCCGVNDGFSVNGPKLGRTATHDHVKALYTALLKYELEGDAAFGEYLRRMPDDLGLPLPDDFDVATQSRIPRASGGLILEDFQTNTADFLLSSSGTPVRHTVSDYMEGRLDDANTAFAHNQNDPINGMTQSNNDHTSIASRGAVFGWDGPATWEVGVPEGSRDLTIRTHLALRIAQATRHTNTVGLDDTLAFGIGLVDGAGTEVVLPSAAYGRITTPYERDGLGAGVGWANEFNTVRIRLVDFESLGLNLADVHTVRLHFGPDHGSPLGRVGLDDIVLEDR